MQKVIFYGFGQSRHSRLIVDGERIWTLNDYYNFPQEFQFKKLHIKPERIYQIHKTFEGFYAPKTDRGIDFEKYNESCAEIVVRKDFGLLRQRFFDDERGDGEFGKDFFTSSFSYMFADAIWDKVEEIELIGIDLSFEGEYLYQLPGMIKNIEAARSFGVRVVNRNEEIWKEMTVTVDFSKVRGIDVKYGDEGKRELKVEIGNIKTEITLSELDINGD